MSNPIQIACENKYGIDYESKARDILPFFFSYTIGTQQEKTIFLNYLYTLFSQMKPLNQQLIDFCVFITTRLNYTGQRLALIELLNDNYDADLRRITINCLDNNFVEGIDIYLDGETDPTPIEVYLDSESNPVPITLFLDSEIQDEDSLYQKDFIVRVPLDVVQSDELIRALLDLYVIAPQNYTIERF